MLRGFCGGEGGEDYFLQRVGGFGGGALFV